MISTETKQLPRYVLPGVRYKGFASNFGGPRDAGVSETEGVAIYNHEQADCRPALFLPRFVTLGGVEVDLARRLNPEADYCACWWDYGLTPQAVLRDAFVQVQRVDDPSQSVYVHPVDAGPARRLNRLIDLSPHAFNKFHLIEDVTEVWVTLLTQSPRWSEMQSKSGGQT